MKYTVIQPGFDPCTICKRNAVSGVVNCSCEFDENGEVEYDCGQCSNGLVCTDCHNRFSGLAISIGVFYG